MNSDTGERLQKVLARAGVGSRRQAETLIREGRVTVDGRVAAIGDSVEPDATISVNGRPVSTVVPTYVALHKPAGYVASTRSTHGEPTVLELMRLPQRLFPVGRLDKDTTGLLFLTNDGDWAQIVLHPSRMVEREYRALVRGSLNRETLRKWREGGMVQGRIVRPESIVPEATHEGNTWIRIVLHEGRKREIRVLAAAANTPVVYLERVRIGSVHLGHLKPGHWRHLSKSEVDSFRGRKRSGMAARSVAPDAVAGGDRRTGRRRQVDSGPGRSGGSRLPVS